MFAAREGIFALVLFISGTSLVSADLEAVKARCDGCHGPNGQSTTPEYPIIAGQTPKFIAKTLRGFQMWDRPCVKCEDENGQKTDMCQIAADLSGEEIEAIANWYGSQTFVPASQDFDASLVAAGEAIHASDCETCHEQGGALAGRGPRLAGQWMVYLESAIQYVPTGERMCPPLMEKKVSDKGKEEITQLLNYWASQQ